MLIYKFIFTMVAAALGFGPAMVMPQFNPKAPAPKVDVSAPAPEYKLAVKGDRLSRINDATADPFDNRPGTRDGVSVLRAAQDGRGENDAHRLRRRHLSIARPADDDLFDFEGLAIAGDRGPPRETRAVLVTFNQNLLDGQLQGLTASLIKARRKLRDLQQQLRRWRQRKVKGKAPALESVRKQVQAICSGQFVKLILKAEVCTVRKDLDLTYSTGQAALDRLCRVQLGKTILFTDNADWLDEDIVLAYRSQYHIENAFRQMKNPHFLGWSPMYHWTDSKIQVHAFYCVLALLLTSLLQRELARQGELLSVNRILEELGGIQQTLIVYPRRQGQRQHSTATCLTRMSPLQSRLFSLLDLKRYAPPSR
jgi:hypothetical protein